MSNADGYISCIQCDETVEEWKYTVRYGQWDVDAQNYDCGRHARHYCRDCFNEHLKRDIAAHYQVEDPDRLWDILAAADGQLVADLSPLYIGSQPFARVVDDEVEAMKTTAYPGGETDDGTPILQMETGFLDDYDRADFMRVLRSEINSPHPALVLLKPAGETPFADYAPIDNDQTRLTEGYDGD